jgi:hypothetical protein
MESSDLEAENNQLKEIIAKMKQDFDIFKKSMLNFREFNFSRVSRISVRFVNSHRITLKMIMKKKIK